MNLSHLKLIVAVILLAVECRSHGNLRSSIPVIYPSKSETPAAATQWVAFTPGESKYDSEIVPGKSKDDSEIAKLLAENAKLKEKLRLHKENDGLKQLLADADTGNAHNSSANAVGQHAIPTYAPVYPQTQSYL
jgi:hypothetical protein